MFLFQGEGCKSKEGKEESLGEKEGCDHGRSREKDLRRPMKKTGKVCDKGLCLRAKLVEIVKKQLGDRKG